MEGSIFICDMRAKTALVCWRISSAVNSLVPIAGEEADDDVGFASIVAGMAC